MHLLNVCKRCASKNKKNKSKMESSSQLASVPYCKTTTSSLCNHQHLQSVSLECCDTVNQALLGDTLVLIMPLSAAGEPDFYLLHIKYITLPFSYSSWKLIKIGLLLKCN